MTRRNQNKFGISETTNENEKEQQIIIKYPMKGNDNLRSELSEMNEVMERYLTEWEVIIHSDCF